MRGLVYSLFIVGIAAPAAGAETITYSYDALGRLTKVSRSGSVNSGAVAAYGYDPANNRTNLTVTAPGGGGGMAAATGIEEPRPAQKKALRRGRE